MILRCPPHFFDLLTWPTETAERPAEQTSRTAAIIIIGAMNSVWSDRLRSALLLL